MYLVSKLATVLPFAIKALISTSMTHATSRIYSMKCYKVVFLKEKEIGDMPVNNKTYMYTLPSNSRPYFIHMYLI